MPIATAALVISALVFGPASSYLAGRRARSPIVWFVLGVLTGPVALLLLVLAPPGRCPECAARIRGWPRSCETCGTPLVGAIARTPARPGEIVVRTVGPAVASGSAASAAPISTPVLRPAVPPPPVDRPVPTSPDVRHTPDRSWEVVATPVASVAASAIARRDDVVGPRAHVIGSAIYLGGSAPTGTRVTRLNVGDRYGLARDGDELHILGPVTIDPERIVARVPIAGADVELTADRLVVQGGATARGMVLAFAGLSVQRGVDVAAILSAPSDEADG